jgi:glycosyltransferase involved in cell wall biosynthesis
MRVLLLASDCNPDWPSLPVVGYKAARAIAEHAEVLLATQIRNRPQLERAGCGRARIHYVDTERIARPLSRLAKRIRGGSEGGWTTGIAFAYPSYLAFEREVWRALGGELRAGAFDIVHRLTPMSPTLPSPLASWSPVPFVLGPLNGGLPWPPPFRAELAREREWLSLVRGAHRALPYHASTFRRASAVLAAFRHTLDDLPPSARERAIDFPEVGVDPELFAQPAERTGRLRKTILFAGRLVPYKLPQLLVRAFAETPALHAHRLVVVGDGPERPFLEEIVRTRRLESLVELRGWQTQAQVAAAMREADVFAFPSIRELGAGVVVEAMASGLACVVVDYGAPAELLANGRGIRVPLADRAALAGAFGAALAQLVADEGEMRRLGEAARRYTRDVLTWEAKARDTLRVYEWVLGRGPRPRFGERAAA